MTSTPHHPDVRYRPSAVIERTRRAFRWTVAAALTAVAIIIGVIAQQIPGRSASTNASNAPAATASPSPTASPPSNATSAGSGGTSLNPPATAPTPTRQVPTAVSGGTGW